MLYSESDLNSLIQSVEREFSLLAKSEDDFKSKDKDESEKEESESEEPKDEKESSEKEESEPKEEKEEEHKEKEEPKSEESSEEHKEEEPKEEGKEQSDEDHGYDEEDMGHLHGMYGSMSKAELRVHHDAIRKCMDGHGLAKCEESMAKSEKDSIIVDHSEVSMLKSELEAAKASDAESKKNLVAVETFLKKFVEKTAPQGKAVTSLDVIAKTEHGQKEKPLQKSEIDAKLLEKAKSPSLSKSDRDAINSYYCGNKNIQTISHLLK